MKSLRAIGIGLLVLGIVLHLRSALYYFLLFAQRNDFGHLYVAGYMAVKGLNFFDADSILRVAGYLGVPRLNPYVYPPFFSLLLIPLHWFSYNTSWLLFTVCSHGAFLLSLSILIRIFRKSDEPAVFWWGLLLFSTSLFDPLKSSYFAGQVNSFLLLLLSLAWLCMQRKRPILAGALLGFGAAVKIAPGFFLLYFLWKKQWKAAASLLAVVAASIIVSIIVLGVDIHVAFLKEVQQMSYGHSTWAYKDQHFHVEPHNQAPSALWYRLLTHNPTTTGIMDSPTLAKSLSYATALFVIVFLLWISNRKTRPNEWEYAFWIIGMLWIPSLLWDHYFTQAIFLMALTWRMLLDGRDRWIAAAALGWMLIGAEFMFSFDSPILIFKSGWPVLMMSLKLYGSVLVMMYLWVNRPDRTQETTISTSENSLSSDMI